MNSHVYIDESGDFGTSLGSSKHLIITSVSTNHPRQLEKLAKKIWKSKPQLQKDSELHALRADDATRLKMLKLVSTIDLQITITKLVKSKVKEDIHKYYYELLAKEVRRNKNAYVIIIDKRDTVKKRNSILSEMELLDLFKRVEFADSKTVKQLQVADFISWSAFQFYENKESKYYLIISNKVNKNK